MTKQVAETGAGIRDAFISPKSTVSASFTKTNVDNYFKYIDEHKLIADALAQLETVKSKDANDAIACYNAACDTDKKTEGTFV